MNTFTGTGHLVRLALRRERAIAPWWILLIVSMSLVMVAYINRYMATQELKLTYLGIITRTPFLHAIGGGQVEPRLEVLATWRSGGFLYVAGAFAALMSVIRHTRREEDAGRTELVRAGVVSRRAPLAAAVLVAAGISLLTGALTAAALITVGLPPIGSIAYGAAIALAGWLFGGLAAVAAQLAAGARTATTIALSVLGLAYVMRFAGDAMGQPWLRYLSPIGWSHLVQPYQGERWWLAGVVFVVGAALYALAFRLLDRRDLGAGMLTERPGPASAPELRGPVSLAWRLHRGLLLKWAVGVAVFAGAAGGLSPLTNDLLTRPSVMLDTITAMIGMRSPSLAAYVWYLIMIMAYAVALYPVLMVIRLRAEEVSGRGEAVLATPLTRLRWAGGHLLVTGLGTAALMAVAGLVFGTVFSLLVGDLAVDLPRFVVGALTTVPAAWSVGAVCLLAYGLAPRAGVAISWLAWVLTCALGQVITPFYGFFGGFPVEPFHYVANAMTGAPYDVRPTLALTAVTALLLAGGLLSLRRRDFG